MKDPDRAKTIIEAVTRATTKPVTIKMRKGWDRKTQMQYILQDCAGGRGINYCSW